LATLFSFISLFQDNSTGLIASAISMICYGFADSLWKIPTQVFGAARSVFLRNIFVVAIVLPYYLISERRSYIAEQAVWATVGIAFLGYIGIYFFARATKNGLTSVVVPVSSTNTLVTLILSIISFDSGFNWISVLGIFIALTGLAMLKINWKNGEFQTVIFKSGGMQYALLAALFWGFSYAYSYYAVTFTGPALFTLMLECIILVLAGLHSVGIQLLNRNSTNDFKKEMGVIQRFSNTGGKFKFSNQWKQNWMLIAMIGVFGATGTIFNSIALDKASINTVTGIVVIAPVISVIFGQVYYGEVLTRQQKWAIFLLIGGVFLISYFRYY
jgi:drug/metabolite transporter (DMT)-like permease